MEKPENGQQRQTTCFIENTYLNSESDDVLYKCTRDKPKVCAAHNSHMLQKFDATSELQPK